ncbi:alpha-ketoglutarate decarboxylase [Olleya sp. Bg11-27]|uniref:alpha-ketoglutarate decarboxylase n=1 Tax=Olleya sp. Bg11-27 TaxID=2058135 RepID=UPI000C300900|nr:alpha-ketoglutarate decarboxylase [Olleya sp. Bg11-27]AUC75130.1 alpha-ketoglutarate decarboxylase [Olleya sp. Bg11-27]
MKIKSINSSKIIILSMIACFFVTFGNAQDNLPQQKSEFWKNVRFGGGLGLSTGSNFFSATLAPTAIYQFDDSFALGVGLNATYNKSKNFYKSTILGASIIGIYTPIRDIQISGEFEQNHVNRNFDNPAFIDDTYWVPSLFIGAGYTTNNITIGIRYDVLYDDTKSIYANAWVPFVRVFF